jgi:hypothetical protein
MRTLRTLTVLALLVVVGRAEAQSQQPSHPFGVGLQLGTSTGFVGKYYMGGRMALAMGLGWVDGDASPYRDDDALNLHLDVLWHPVILVRTEAFTLPLFAGVGARYKHDDDDYGCGDFNLNGRIDAGECWDDDDDHIGVRGPVGVLMDFNKVPLDVFFELALVIDLIHLDDDDVPDRYDDDDVNLYGAIGARYYF